MHENASWHVRRRRSRWVARSRVERRVDDVHDAIRQQDVRLDNLSGGRLVLPGRRDADGDKVAARVGYKRVRFTRGRSPVQGGVEQERGVDRRVVDDLVYTVHRCPSYGRQSPLT